LALLTHAFTDNLHHAIYGQIAKGVSSNMFPNLLNRVVMPDEFLHPNTSLVQ